MISLHNHTLFCDGNNSPAEMAKSAIENGVTHFGLSSHAPVLRKNEWSIKNMKSAELYAADLEKTKRLFPELHFYKGLEADYIPGESIKFDVFRQKLNLDFIIGSVHLVKNENGIWFIDGPTEGYDRGLEKNYNKDFHAAMKNYYFQIQNMLEEEKFEILAHCDKVMMNNKDRYIRHNDPSHLSLLKDTLKLAKEKDIWVEINTRGLYKGIHNDFYPGTYIFPFIKKEKIRIIYSADAHNINEITKGYSELNKAIGEYELQNLVVTPKEIEERFA